MELNELRKRIDRIDSELLKLLGSRMEIAVRTRKMKREVTDPPREEAILASLRNRSKGLVTPEFAQRVFQEVLTESKRLQQQNLVLVGFQGEHGAYSEIAVRTWNSAAIPLPCAEFSDVFEGVQNGSLDRGIVPVENSLEGGVNAVSDLLAKTNLHVVGEIRVPIRHCLLALPDTDYREIKTVYSHPQALGQCRGFIARNKLEARPHYDTAGSARMLAAERPKAAAVIASRLCAEIYNLEVLKENIEDHESNSTRFLVLSQQKEKTTGTKCSIVFSTQHKAGALFSVLRIFADAGLNLTRIESRPIRDERRKFAFLLDFQGSDQDPKVQDALEKARQQMASFRLLGCYPEAKA